MREHILSLLPATNAQRVLLPPYPTGKTPLAFVERKFGSLTSRPSKLVRLQKMETHDRQTARCVVALAVCTRSQCVHTPVVCGGPALHLRAHTLRGFALELLCDRHGGRLQRKYTHAARVLPHVGLPKDTRQNPAPFTHPRNTRKRKEVATQQLFFSREAFQDKS